MVRQVSSTFTLTITKQTNDYAIEVHGPKGTHVPPQPAPQLKALLADEEVIGVLKRLSNKKALATPDEIQNLGQILYGALFSAKSILLAFGKAQGSANSENGVRLKLRIEPSELAVFPWETLYDGKDWLATQSTTPLVRQLILADDSRSLKKLQVRGALRILFVGASPEDLDPLEIEGIAEELEGEQLSELIKKKKITFDVLLNATLADLQEALLKDYHILYFSGHGSPQGIYLDDGQGDPVTEKGKTKRGKGDKFLVSAKVLAQALEGKQTRLIFLAACETSKASEESRLLRGFAQELVEQSKLPAIVAMQYFISDMQANPLSRHFFAALAVGRPVDVALAESRAALIKNIGRDVFSPVLYLQAEDSALFPRTKNWAAIGLSVALVIATIVGGVLYRNVEIQQIQSSQSSAEAKLASGSELDAIMDSLRAGKALKQSVWQSIWPKAGLREEVTGTLRKVFYAARERDRWTWSQGNAREVFFKPDGQPSLITSTDSSFSLLDLQSNASPISLRRGHKIIISPQGDKIAILEENGRNKINEISLYNLNGQPLLTPIKANNAAFSPNNKLVLISSENSGNIQILDQQRQLITSFSGIKDKLHRAYYNFALQQLITFTTDDSYSDKYIAQVWYQDGRSELLGRRSNTEGVRAVRLDSGTVQFSQNGKSLLIVTPSPNINLFSEGWKYEKCLQSNTLCWDEPESNRFPTMITGTGDITNPNNSDQELVAVPVKGTVSLFDGRGLLIHKLGGSIGDVQDVTFSPDGRLLATAGNDKTVRLWDLQGSQPQKLGEFNNQIQHVAFSSGKNQFASFQQDGVIKLWDLNGKLLSEFRSPITQIKDIALSNDGKYIAVVEENGSVHLWAVQNNQLTEIAVSMQEINSISFSPDNQRLATAGRDEFIRIWNLKGSQQQEFNTKLKATDFDKGIKNIFFSPDGQSMVAQGTSNSIVLSLSDGAKREMISSGSAFKSTKELLSVFEQDGGGANTFLLRDSQGASSVEFKEETSNPGIRASTIKLSPDGTLFAAAERGKVLVWDISGKKLAKFQVFSDGTGDEIKSLHFSSDGQRLITLTKSGLMTLWSIGNLDELLTRSCDWVRDYLAHSPNAADRHLCDGIENATSSIAANPPPSPSHTSAPKPSSSETASETVPISPSAPPEPVTVAKTIGSPPPKITQKEALNLIREWLQQKQQVFTPPYNLEVLSKYTSKEYYQSKRSEAEKYRLKGAQVRFSGIIVKPTSTVLVKTSQAIIGVSVTEACTYIKGKTTGDCSSQNQAYRYTLQFDGNHWKIIKATKD